MARAGKAHGAEDLWHLSIDDLLAPPKETARLASSGPFALNLSTSTAHMAPPPQGLRKFEGLYLYQLRRGSDEQPRFHLRLGIIATEIEADAILSHVLEYYPGATKCSVDDDDRDIVAERIRAAAPPKPATPAEPVVETTAEAQPLTPNAAPPATAVKVEPLQPFHWDVDEILPGLAVTRPAPPESPTRMPRAQDARPQVAERVPAHADDAVALPAADPDEITATRLSPGPVVAEELDCDPDAITAAVEIPTFTFEADEITSIASAPKSEAQHSETSPLEEPALDSAPTIEVVTADALMIEVAAVAAPIPEAPTPEAPTIEVATSEIPTVEVATAEAPTIDVAAASTPILEVAVEDPLPSALNIADPPADIAVASAAMPESDSGTLEQLVAKISALVETADACDRSASSPKSPSAASEDEPTRAPTAAAPTAVAATTAPSPWEAAPSAPAAIDSTQTVRALTPLELADTQSSQWFSIQLALSEEHIDPATVPSLDIFNEYRLYAVTGLVDENRVMHALRMGFFSSAVAAEAVAGYLNAFFDSPSIKRVSLAERERFAADTGVTARKDVGATGLHAVIELAGPTPLPERRGQIASSGKRDGLGSLWSRLVAPLKR